MKKNFTLLTISFFCFISVNAQQIGAGQAPRIDDLSAPLGSGMYISGEVHEGYPDTQDRFKYMITINSTNAYNYQMQISGTYAENDRLFFRKIVEKEPVSKNTKWHEIATRGANTFVGNQTVQGKLTIDGSQTINGGLTLKDGSLRVDFSRSIYVGASSEGNTMQLTASETTGYINLKNRFHISQGDKRLFSITDNGNIGIRNASPATAFHVNGTIRCTDQIVDAAQTVNSLLTLNGNMRQAPGKLLELGYAGSGNVKLMISTHADYGAYVDYSSTLEIRDKDRVNVMHFSKEGNVGIGKSYANHKLEVNGNIRAKGLILETFGWSDFVFEADYNLPTLNEVSSHIQEYGHLPGIPSAKEVEENGINVSEIQAKLLQKIEELTLYLIEENKSNKELKEYLEEQQKLIDSLQEKISVLESL